MSKLAVQLHTIREHTKTAAGFDETLRRISAIGYTASRYADGYDRRQ